VVDTPWTIIEPKYGLAVTGVVHPEKILKNSGAQEGDALILTKPLGTGVLFNASKSKSCPYRELELILPHVASLNKIALNIALEYDIHACTDVTGFGLAGHTLEIAKGSRKTDKPFLIKRSRFIQMHVRCIKKVKQQGATKQTEKSWTDIWR